MEEANLYDDAPGPSETVASPESQEERPATETEDSPTAVISKDAFGGHECKPGDQYTIEVVRVNEADLEVKVVGYGDEESEEMPAEEPPSEMGAMME